MRLAGGESAANWLRQRSGTSPDASEFVGVSVGTSTIPSGNCTNPSILGHLHVERIRAVASRGSTGKEMRCS